MTAEEDFEIFYEKHMLPVMEEVRYRAEQPGPWMVVGLVSAMLIVLIWFVGSVNELNNYEVLVVILLFVIVVSFFKYYKQKELYEDQYKTSVIQAIINYISPGIVYNPRHCLGQDVYDKSSLYRRYYDRFTGGDLMEGTITGVHFRCSELFTYYSSTGRSRGDTPIFGGLFFVIDISNRFTGGTYIWPKGDEQLPVSIYSDYYRMMPMPAITGIIFNDAEFDYYFSGYTTYLSQATEILTREFRNELVLLRKSLQVNFSISFVAGECFMAIPFSTDLLQPPANMNEIKEDIRYDFEMVQKIVNTVRCLSFSKLL